MVVRSRLLRLLVALRSLDRAGSPLPQGPALPRLDAPLRPGHEQAGARDQAASTWPLRPPGGARGPLAACPAARKTQGHRRDAYRREAGEARLVRRDSHSGRRLAPARRRGGEDAGAQARREPDAEPAMAAELGGLVCAAP